MAATMNSMQILVFELRNSTRLGKGYARHQLGLHMLVLEQLRKTYWTADVQHSLFTTVLKSIGDELAASEAAGAHTPDSSRPGIGDMGPPSRLPDSVEPSLPERAETEADQVASSYESCLAAFMPFAGLRSYSDELGYVLRKIDEYWSRVKLTDFRASDWDVSDSVSLESIHSNHSNQEEPTVTAYVDSNGVSDK